MGAGPKDNTLVGDLRQKNTRGSFARDREKTRDPEIEQSGAKGLKSW